MDTILKDVQDLQKTVKDQSEKLKDQSEKLKGQSEKLKGQSEKLEALEGLQAKHEVLEGKVVTLQRDVIVLGRREVVNVVEKRINVLLDSVKRAEFFYDWDESTIHVIDDSGMFLFIQPDTRIARAAYRPGLPGRPSAQPIRPFADCVLLEGSKRFFRDLAAGYKAALENRTDIPTKTNGILVPVARFNVQLASVFSAQPHHFTSNESVLKFLQTMQHTAKFLAKAGHMIAHRPLAEDSNHFDGLDPSDHLMRDMVAVLVEASRF